MEDIVIKIQERLEQFNEQEWLEWHQRRIHQASNPIGPSKLVGTHWINSTTLSHAHSLPDLPGRWYRRGGGVVGAHLPPAFTITGTLQILPGEIAQTNTLNLTVIERLGEVALEVYDQLPPAEPRFRSIETFSTAPEWRLKAKFQVHPESVNLTAADGLIVPTPTVGWVVFEVQGREYRLRACGRGDKLRLAFRDRSSNQGVFRFRYLEVDLPDDKGDTIIDFNRAFLPPIAFSEHYLCAEPSIANTLDLEVTAGEKWVLA